MTVTIHYNTPHAIVHISDPTSNEDPRLELTGVVTATDELIVVCTTPDCDGSTRFRFSDDAANTTHDLDMIQAFDGIVMTPSGVLDVNTSELDRVFRFESLAYLTRVRIWVNHQNEPDKVDIVVERCVSLERQ